MNSRKVMASVLDSYGITDEKFAPVCVVMDKLDKIGADAKEELELTQGLPAETANKIVDCLACKSVDELQALCGDGVDQSGIDELKRLFELARITPRRLAHLRRVRACAVWRTTPASSSKVSIAPVNCAPFAVAVDTTSYSPCTAP